jgi:hypothetical protein
MPLLRSLFEKDISRYIETVIKADDSEHLIDEMNEYVLTSEVAGKVIDVFENYGETGLGGNQSDGPNGCWISGFFGSGKSHLLKMISYTLENRVIKGQKLGELFLKKIKEQKDPKLAADVEKSLRIPSESILFNIDQKSDAINSQGKDADAILSVFYKVFNEHCGYSTAHFLAGIERHLQKSGKYEAFKTVFQKKFNATWEESRSGLHLIAQDFAEAYAEVSGLPLDRANELFDKYDTQFKLSIEDFANDVSAYIETKPAGFRLNFFVDEVGQYIGNNSKLMLNLQTIVETLATKTKKRSWVFVTSQSDLNTAIGDVTGQQQQDFSKINARFIIKIPLTSRNAEEVIRKRLLQKNPEGVSFFSHLYEIEKNNLGTIFHFREGIKYKHFQDDEQFVHLSPFIPYQSDLFQQCIKGLSEHNTFQGKHQSFGERSMLGVFQLAAKSLADEPAGTWATFDKFYDGIEGTLRPEVIQLITVSQKHLDKELEKSLLKILFLVKYTVTFKATAQNLSVLMIPKLDTDLEAHEKKVLEALNLLEYQTYIKRTSDGYYEFLTSEEKDIQTEINQTSVSHPEITSWIADAIFKDVMGGYKITCQANGQPYEYYRKIDDTADGLVKILGINLVTRFHDHYDDHQRLFASNMTTRDLMIRLDNSPFDLTREVAGYLKTDRYTKQQHNITESRKLILDGIRLQHNDREKVLRQRIESLLSTATLILNGSVVNVGSSNGKVRIQEAFQLLIGAVYTDLKMLPSSSYNDEQVRRLLTLPTDDIFSVTPLNTAENEVLTKIRRKDNEGQRIAIADCIREFQQPSYGWYISAILYQIASLVQKGLIDISLDTERQSPKELASLILNSQKQNNLIVCLKETYSEKDISALSKFYLDLFDENLEAKSPSEYAEKFRQRLIREVDTLKSLHDEFTTLPAAQCLENTYTLFAKYTEREEKFYLREIIKKDDDFADVREKSKRITTILLNNNQKSILQRALTITDRNSNANYDFLPADKREKLYSLCMAERLDDIPAVKSLCDELDEFVRAQLYTARTEAVSAVKEAEGYFSNEPSFGALSEDEKKQAFLPLASIEKAIATDAVIANVIHKKNTIKDCYTAVSDTIARLEKQKAPPKSQEPSPKTSVESSQPQVQTPKQKPIISSASITIKKTVPVIETIEQLDQYLAVVKTAWGDAIKAGSRISI